MVIENFKVKVLNISKATMHLQEKYTCRDSVELEEEMSSKDVSCCEHREHSNHVDPR